MVLFYCIALFYLCHSFIKENEVFLKIIYIIIMLNFPNLHFIGNQGTYTLNTSLKVTSKCIGVYADDNPIIMGIFFTLHKFRFFITFVFYCFDISKFQKKKLMNYYTSIIRLFVIVHLFSFATCFLVYIKNKRESSYVQILFMIATKAMVILLFDICIIVNYLFTKLFTIFFSKILSELKGYQYIGKEITDIPLYNKDDLLI